MQERPLVFREIIIDTLRTFSYSYPPKKGVMKRALSRSSKNSLHRKHGIIKKQWYLVSIHQLFMISWRCSWSAMLGFCCQPSTLWGGVPPHDEIHLCIVCACVFNDWVCLKGSAAGVGASPCQSNWLFKRGEAASRQALRGLSFLL